MAHDTKGARPAVQRRNGSLIGVASQAVAQFSKLSGRAAESVTGAKAEGEGWSLLVDVVELERTPPTLSVLATYRVDTDHDGNLLSYERLRRFTRNAID
jgi:hypothetical protein